MSITQPTLMNKLAKILTILCLVFSSYTWAQKQNDITLNFDKTSIISVAKTMGIITNRNIIVDPRVSGELTLITNRPVSITEAWNQFVSALRLQKYTIVQSAGLYKIVPESDAKLQTGQVLSAKQTGRENQVVTKIFKLNYENASQVLQVVRPLISPDFSVTQSNQSNSIIITDYIENINRIEQIINAMDRPNISKAEIIKLDNAFAKDVAELINRSLINENRLNNVKPIVLADYRSNGIIIRAANDSQLAQIKKMVRQLDTAVGYDEDNIRVVYLKNAEAKHIAATLNLLFNSATQQRQDNSNITTNSNRTAPSNANSGAPTLPVFDNPSRISGSSMVLADETNNALIINAPKSVYRQLRNVIDLLDNRRAQVYVESLIAEVNTSKLAQMGIQWQNLAGSLNGQNSIGIIGTNYGDAADGNIFAVAGAGKNIYDNKGINPSVPLPIPQGFNAGFALAKGGEFILGALANFIQSNGDGNILSTPTVLTLDNEEAKIVVGQNIPILTSSNLNNAQTPFNTYDRKDVGITLQVKPQISENGTIQMSIFQETSSIDDTNSQVFKEQGIIVNKRSITSKVLVQDGQVIVIGGLLSDSYSEANNKVPLLGDLPIIGNLFKRKNRKSDKKNLMVFLRPVIVQDAQAALNYSTERYYMMQNLQKQVNPNFNLLLNNINQGPVLPDHPKRFKRNYTTTPNEQNKKYKPRQGKNIIGNRGN